MKNIQQSLVTKMLLALLFIVFVIFLFAHFVPHPPSQNQTKPTPAPTISPTPTIPNTKNLSAEELLARDNIFNILPYMADGISIVYLPESDVFQVEILIPDIAKAKNEAVVWFKNQGFSQQTICTYPVQFYVNTAVAEEIRPQNITFTPFAPGC